MDEATLYASLQRLSARPIVVASHPRSGTHLMIDLLRKQFAECRSWKFPGERLDRLYCNLDIMHWDPAPVPWSTAVRILGRTSRPVVKTHAWPDWQWWFFKDHSGELGTAWKNWLDRNAEFMYVYRDGRAVMCSYYLFCRGCDPDVRNMGLSTFMRQSHEGRSRVAAWADHVRAWMGRERVRSYRFEDVTRRTDELLQTLARDMDLTRTYRQPMLPRPLRRLTHSRLQRLFGVRPESSAVLGDQKGPAKLRWQEQFTLDDRRFFHEESEGLLVELGYEANDEWVAGKP